ncbi:MAG: OstA-like protein [Fodinibius sp.]|nr:OstA-like protein [Fodinibius sp.]
MRRYRADSTTLFGNSVDYRFSTKVAHFLDEIRLEDQRGTLLANSGFYYREADSAEFRGQVQLADSLQYLEGDSLFSNRSNEYYELYGDIYGNDRENNSMIQGNYLESDSTGRRLLRGAPKQCLAQN